MSALITRGDSRPDRREGGTWTAAQSARNTLLAFLIRGALAVAVPLSPRWLRGLGRGLGRVAPFLFRRANAIADANLSLAFPEATPASRRALLRDVWLTLGEHLGDALASLDVHRAVEPLPTDAHSLSLLRSDGISGGVMFVSAHLGPWERVAASLVHHGVPLTALAREAYDPRLSHVYERLRQARGIDVIYRGHPSAAMRLVRTLRARRVLGIPMDLRSRVPSIRAPFLGRLAATPRGPARIALRTRSAVVVGTVAPGADGGDHSRALRITCTTISTDDLQADDAGELLLTERINAELTARILALPRHWVWMHDRFAEMDPVD